MMYSETIFPVRYYETDQMGIVHHSNYIRYFECARNVLMAEGGYPIEKCEEDGVTIPIVKMECNYKHPAKMGDIVRCVAIIEQEPLAKLYVKQAVYNQDNVLCAEGQATLGFLNKGTGRPTRCPDKLLEMIRKHINDK
ncbi:MAG: thioesterase family protein [Bacteroidales bacterium]|nr:thioesterase family protein [Bacteroidales bacterium]MDY2935987.1 thioesterase family protein [Candidatus Cryptobacteroides sp.]